MVKLCLKFIQGRCPFQNEYCWFIHNMTETNDDLKEDAMDIENISVFQKVIEQTDPPSYQKMKN